MLRVMFFASFRERLNTRQVEVPLAAPATVAQVIAGLIDQGGEPWREVLEGDNVVMALNQAVCEPGTTVRDGDELAFYPPVTGG